MLADDAPFVVTIVYANIQSPKSDFQMVLPFFTISTVFDNFSAFRFLPPRLGLRADWLLPCCGLPAPAGHREGKEGATRPQQNRTGKATIPHQEGNETATRPQQKGTNKAARPQQDRNRGATTCNQSVDNLLINRYIIFH